MRPRRKPIADQVIVVTGASSGIGLATSRLAAERGARVVLAARNVGALKEVVEEIRYAGGLAEPVVADVGDEEDVRKIGRLAVERFGGIDTWVNNAGVSIYGRILQVPLQEQRRLFETNYWGLVHGSRVAVGYMRRAGGVLVNIGSVLSDRAIPLQGPYSASKHAVKAFTDALRMELEHDRIPIAVTLVKPGAIDTPYEEHARNWLDAAPRNPPPYYAPRLVARAILHAAEHAPRDIYVGGGGRALSLMGILAPRLSDRLMQRTLFAMQRRDEPPPPRGRHALDRPGNDGRERSSGGHWAREHSLYTGAALHPAATAALALGLGATLGLIAQAARRR